MTPKVLNCASTKCYSAKQASDLSPTENFAASADKYRYYRANWVRNGGQELRGIRIRYIDIKGIP